jgi:hypothetical protein
MLGILQNNTADTLVSDPSAFVVELENEKLKRHKAPGTDHFPAELD